MLQFGVFREGVIPKPGALPPGGGSPVEPFPTVFVVARDPSLRLKNGSAQDDANGDWTP